VIVSTSLLMTKVAISTMLITFQNRGYNSERLEPTSKIILHLTYNACQLCNL